MSRVLFKLSFSMLVLAFATTATFAASSGVINVDLDYTSSGATYTGLAEAPDPAGGSAIWNSATTSSTSSLEESDGTTTGVSFGISNSPFFLGPYTDANLTVAVKLFEDFAYSGADIDTFTISGLTAGVPYDLYLYAMTGIYAGDTTFVVNSTTTEVTNNPEGFDGGHFVGVTPGTTGDGNFVLYSHLYATNVLGVEEITGTFTGVGTGRFNGFQLVEAPEPASLGLLLAGGVMLFKRRRRVA